MKDQEIAKKQGNGRLIDELSRVGLFAGELRAWNAR